MASERTPLVGVKAQETQVHVITQEASMNGAISTRTLSSLVRAFQARRIDGNQRREATENEAHIHLRTLDDDEVGSMRHTDQENQDCCCAPCCKALYAEFLRWIARLAIAVALVVFAVALPMVVIGSVYFNECPAEKSIPIYLIVAGVVLLLMFLGILLVVINVQHMDFNDSLSPHYCNRVVCISTATYSAVVGASSAVFLWYCDCCFPKVCQRLAGK
ncbi:uncharacterized protein LOC135394772 isoform X1 [Ornithodoros turicata]|uniref:uncharacterized protein LOC135394772 isoform X1 n=1 Tax=Ornithodoros turicata TaxID=34597 RepID=UPI00313931AE